MLCSPVFPAHHPRQFRNSFLGLTPIRCSQSSNSFGCHTSENSPVQPLPQIRKHVFLTPVFATDPRLPWGSPHSPGKRTSCGQSASSRMWPRGETTMRKVLFLLMLFPGALLARSPQEPRPASSGVSGRWVVNTDFYGATIYFRMELKQEGEKLTGNFDGDKLEGTLKGSTIYFLAKDEQGGTDEGKGMLQGGTITGTVVI